MPNSQKPNDNKRSEPDLHQHSPVQSAREIAASELDFSTIVGVVHWP